MDLKIGVSGQVRGNAPRLAGVGTLENMELSPRAEAVIQQSFPAGTESVRLGEAFYTIQGTGVVALNAAVPTTTAATTLWNGNAAGGKSLIVVAVGATCTTSAAAAAQWQLFVEPSIVTAAAVLTTADTGHTRSLLTGLTYGGGALVSKTVTVTDNGWLPVGKTTLEGALTGTIGYTVGGPLVVPFIIRPQYYLAVAHTAVNATLAAKTYFVFYEVQLPTL